mmetsp:Transcript_11668/g.27797  ORF Transcript_11668/g.27797 Transcript_11668/m.27797 type:complete len:209 (+) Transcript_11668:259-885(+)
MHKVYPASSHTSWPQCRPAGHVQPRTSARSAQTPRSLRPCDPGSLLSSQVRQLHAARALSRTAPGYHQTLAEIVKDMLPLSPRSPAQIHKSAVQQLIGICNLHLRHGNTAGRSRADRPGQLRHTLHHWLLLGRSVLVLPSSADDGTLRHRLHGSHGFRPISVRLLLRSTQDARIDPADRHRVASERSRAQRTRVTHHNCHSSWSWVQR